MPQVILQYMYKFDIMIGILSGTSAFLSIISYIVEAKEMKKKNKKLYIMGFIIFIILLGNFLYLKQYTIVPNVTGKYYKDACSILSDNQLAYNPITNPEDFKVTGQSIEAGYVVKKETLVELVTENMITSTNETIPTETESNTKSSESQSDPLPISASEKSQATETPIISEKAPDASPVYTYTDMSSVMYATQSVNVRDLPGTEGQIIDQLTTGQEMQITGQCNESGWYRLAYNGQTAYVSDHYISMKNTRSDISTTVVEGQNPKEAVFLMDYINQYRTAAGVNELAWNQELEQIAQAFAEPSQLENQDTLISCQLIGRQCNGAKTAQRAVSDWIEGNQWVSSESGRLLNSEYTQMGGALYYYPNGNAYGYHYIWIVCLQ